MQSNSNSLNFLSWQETASAELLQVWDMHLCNFIDLPEVNFEVHCLYHVLQKKPQVTTSSWMTPVNRRCKKAFLHLNDHTNIVNLECYWIWRGKSKFLSSTP